MARSTFDLTTRWRGCSFKKSEVRRGIYSSDPAQEADLSRSEERP